MTHHIRTTRECPNCHSANGKEGTKEIRDKKVDVWKCLDCNGEHKITLKAQVPEEAHATTTSTPKTLGDGKILTGIERETSEHEKTERPATRRPSADPE